MSQDGPRRLCPYREKIDSTLVSLGRLSDEVLTVTTGRTHSLRHVEVSRLPPIARQFSNVSPMHQPQT